MSSPDWITLYKQAVLETNNAQFAVKAGVAKTAIHERITVLEDERKALSEALQNLDQLLATRSDQK